MRAPGAAVAAGSRLPPARDDRSPRTSTAQERAWAVVRRRSPAALVLLVLLGATAVLQLVNLAGGRRTPGEAAIAAYAQGQASGGGTASVPAVPLLVWGPVRAWLQHTGALQRHPEVVVAGREAMLLPVLAAVVLLWLLARSLRLSRTTAAVAVLLFALIPPAAELHRLLDGAQLAVPLLLAGFVLALAPGRRVRRLLLAALSAGCVATAVLVHPASLLLLPAWAWWIGRGAPRGGRRWRVVVALAGLALVAVVAAMVERAGVGLLVLPDLSAVRAPHQLLALLLADGTVLAGGTLTMDGGWLILLALAALVLLAEPRFWPLVLALLPAGLLALSGDPVLLLPFAALALPAAGEHLLRRAARSGSGVGRWLPRVAAGLAAVGLLGLGSQVWPGELRALAAGDSDASQAQAQAWLQRHADREQTVLIDGAIGAGLDRLGFPERNVVWAGAPVGVASWRQLDYLVLTPTLRQQVQGRAAFERALQESTSTAVFGTGADQVEVRRVHPEGRAVAQQRAEQERVAAAAAGAELVQNPALRLSPEVVSELESGQVDARVLIGLSRIGALGEIEVVGLPEVAGEESTGAPRRQVLLRSLDGVPFADAPDAVAVVGARLGEQEVRYAPRSLEQRPDGLLVTWGVDAPWGLLGGGGGP